MKHGLGGWRLTAAVLLCLGLTRDALAAPTQQAHAARPLASVAIVIDDLGYRHDAGTRAIHLPGAVTVAVLPYRKHSRQLALEAVAAGKELILHAPMEPRNEVPWEKNGLSSELPLADLQQALDRMLLDLPEAAGINNHMGSKFTEHGSSMQWLMGELKRRKLFFVDSLTTSGSLGWQAARQVGVPCVRRDIFLDNVPEPEAVEKQLRKLIEIARMRGYALAIGHPHDATLEVLEKYLPRFGALGVELVPASKLIQQADNIQAANRTEADAPEPVVGESVRTDL